LHTRLPEVERIRLRFRDDEGVGYQSREGYTLDL
jgi:hypothetical protein